MDKSNLRIPRLPLAESLANAIPEAQPHTFFPGALDITAIECLRQGPDTCPDAHLVRTLQGIDLGLAVGGRPNFFNRLLHLHDLHERLRVQGMFSRGILRRDIDAVPFPEKILGALEGVGQSAMGFVDAGGEPLGMLLGRTGRVLIGMHGTL